MARQQSTVARARIHSPHHSGVSQEALLELHPDNPKHFEIATSDLDEDHFTAWRAKPRFVSQGVDPDTLPCRLIRTEEGVQPIPGDLVLVTVRGRLYLSTLRADKGFVEESNPIEAFRQDLVAVCGVVVEEIQEAPKKVIDRAAGPHVRQPPPFELRTPDNYIEDITCTSRTGEEIPAHLFVPYGNYPECEEDEIGAFRLALSAPRTPGLFFAARVRIDYGGELFPHNSLPIFDVEAKPRDGDVVCAVSFTKDRSDTLPQRALFNLAICSNHLQRLVDWLGWSTSQPETKTYLLRRYKTLSDGYRLESLNGSQPTIQKSRLVDIELLGVATKHRPWGIHRVRVMF